jgi:hypothetical protein
MIFCIQFWIVNLEESKLSVNVIASVMFHFKNQLMRSSRALLYNPFF